MTSPTDIKSLLKAVNDAKYEQQMKAAIFIAISILFSLNALGGPGGHITGGGYGVVDKNNIYLLDLVEAGVTNASASDIEGEKRDFRWALYDFNFLTHDEQRILADKLNQLSVVNPVLATSVVKAIRAYDWILTPSPLKPVAIADQLLIEHVVQLAVRKSQSVYVDASLWARVPPVHRAAFVLHEVLSALLDPHAPALWARQLTGALFALPERTLLPSAISSETQRFWPSAASLRTLIGNLSEYEGCGPDTCLSLDVVNTEGPIASWEVYLYPFMVRANADDGVTTLFLNRLNETRLTTDLCGDTRFSSVRVSYYDFAIKVEPALADEIGEPYLQVKLEPKLIGLPMSLGRSSTANCPAEDASQLRNIRSLIKF